MNEVLFLFIFVETAFFIGLAGMFFGSMNTEGATRNGRWKKFAWYFVIAHVVIITGVISSLAFAILTSALATAAVIEIALLTKKRYAEIRPRLAGFAACLLCAASGVAAASYAFFSQPGRPLFLYAVVSVLDSYSQIGGQLIGRHKLAPRISPAKTIEGSVCGMILAIAAACVLHDLGGFTLQAAFGAGLLSASSGVLADLAASWYKRKAGVKDYSAVLPGQGGVIDRFNSFFGASVSMWVYSLFVK